MIHLKSPLVASLMAIAMGAGIYSSSGHTRHTFTMTFTGEAIGDGIGVAIASVGGVKNDGYADMIVGAPPKPSENCVVFLQIIGQVIDSATGVPVSGVQIVVDDHVWCSECPAPGTCGLVTTNANGTFIISRICSVPFGENLNIFCPCLTAGREAYHTYTECLVCTGLWDPCVGLNRTITIPWPTIRLQPITPPGCCQLAGDANNDGSVNITDITFLIVRIFVGGAAPPCADEADANGDNSVNIADVTFLIARIFAGGAAPVCGTTGT